VIAPASPSSVLAGEVAFEAPGHVREELAALGRTEDVRLSPRGTRLAVACYSRSQIAVAELEIARASSDGRLTVAVGQLAFHDAPSLEEPHGVDFVDDETLVVANRGGELTLLRLPPRGTRDPARPLGSLACALGAAGSVVARPAASGETELLVVHNWANALARYRATPDGSITIGETIARRWLDVPDGLAASADGEWLAVSNHSTHDVFVFDATSLHVDADPLSVLRGVAYPHGLRFVHDDRLLLVADAGAPYVDVFVRPEDGWAGAQYASSAIRIMDEDTFLAGRHSSEEGGPKGIDVDPRTNMLVVTSEAVPLAFFDLDVALERAARRPAADLVRYELDRVADLARAKADAEEARERLRAVLATKAWRATMPLRRAYGALRR
jgi:DNA-binding beta-propeller fold protein YncE